MRLPSAASKSATLARSNQEAPGSNVGPIGSMVNWLNSDSVEVGVSRKTGEWISSQALVSLSLVSLSFLRSQLS